MERSLPVIIHLGGSLVVPHLSDDGGVAVKFLKEFQEFVFAELQMARSFILVIGGGKTARIYQKSLAEITQATSDDLDWVGIYATHLNARLIQLIFQDEAYSKIIDHEPSARELQHFKNSKKKILVAAGWYPGQSSDHIAVELAKKVGAKEFIIAGDIPFVYEKDPKKFLDAKPIEKMSWKQYLKIIPQTWSPGLSIPIDPVSARLAAKVGMCAKILRGTDLANFQKAIEGKQFSGTIISHH